MSSIHTRTPWNKGTKGLQSAWNKGIFSDYLGSYTVNQVNDMYWKQGLSLPKIADLVGRTNCTVFSFMRKHKIPTRDRRTSNTRRRPRLEVICTICGKKRSLLASAIESGQGKFCSVACKAESQRGKPTWNKGKPWPPETLRKIRAARMRHPTRPEIRMMEIVQMRGLPLEYTGNGAVWIGRQNPDFVSRTNKVAVEIFGDFWHSPLRNSNIPASALLERRKKEFEQHGWHPVFIWESEIMSQNGERIVIERLKDVF